MKQLPEEILCIHCKNADECKENSVACDVFLELESVIDEDWG